MSGAVKLTLKETSMYCSHLLSNALYCKRTGVMQLSNALMASSLASAPISIPGETKSTMW